mgnify:CR=1 FL=1
MLFDDEEDMVALANAVKMLRADMVELPADMVELLAIMVLLVEVELRPQSNTTPVNSLLMPA